MFDHLQITNPRERLAVGLADVALAPLGWTRPTPAAGPPPQRVLLLRLERIGDLLMTHAAIVGARALWPDATIDLAVGSWNAPLAAMMPEVSRVLTVDVPWLAREGTGQSWPALVRTARSWRAGRYDLAINFEPDIRSNALAWLSGATRRAGFWTGGGGRLLTTALSFDPHAHVADNAARLLDAVSPTGHTLQAPTPRLVPDDLARAAVDRVLGGVSAGRRLVGVHVSGGRQSKQWHLDRFADVGRALAETESCALVLTGSAGDRALVETVRTALGDVPVIDTAGHLTLPETAALLARLDVLVTGDTGPMHLASAVGTPVVALFGPSDPRRYGPRGGPSAILRVQLPCSPCGQVRLPPERCRGHVPDCMDGISVEVVVAAARQLLGSSRP
jgi:lipopolysaccharide heptosyltransferase II